MAGYELRWEAQRSTGADFFAALTFPVGDLKRCVTLVNGGWGGSVVGISCVDDLNASEQPQSTGYNFVNGRWYAFLLQVTPEAIRVVIDGNEQFVINVKGRRLSMHPSEIRLCEPLGFGSFSSAGVVRGLQMRALQPGELVPKAEE